METKINMLTKTNIYQFVAKNVESVYDIGAVMIKLLYYILIDNVNNSHIYFSN